MILYHGSYLEIDRTEAIRRLRYGRPNLQICFRTEQALDFFYHSKLYRLVSEGVSDLHCMSDAYLAEKLKMEYQEECMTNNKEDPK